jgi:hypothetical protein
VVIRFLQTCASENPEYPFQAGQVITVTCPSRYLLSLVDGIRAEAIPTDETERAVIPALSQPEPAKKKGRRRVTRP